MTNIDNRSKAELDLITVLEENHQISQTKLAKRVGIAVGLVNILMKRAVTRGAIKIKQIPARRYAYYLTPKGFAEKAKLVTRYLDSSLHLYRKLRIEYRDIFTNLEAKGIHEIVLVGDVDIAELAIMAAFDSNVTIIGLVNEQTNKNRVGLTPVTSKLEDEYSGTLVICDARAPQACFDALTQRFVPEQIFYPKSYHISEVNTVDDDEAVA